MAAPVPKEMKALLHDSKTHRVTRSTLPVPRPSPTQYLVKVHATGITKGELLWQETGSVPSPIPGFDVSGEILQSPSPSSKFQPGEKVYALTSFSRQANAREITVIEEREIASMPQGMSWTDAASVPMSSLTAWQALFVKAGLVGKECDDENKGVRVLINGASGAVGIWAVQLAKWAGVHVVGICGSRNVGFVKDLGADETVNYRETSLKQWVQDDEDRKFDLVLDCVGGETVKEAWTAVKKGGVLISIVQPVDGLKPEDSVSDEAVGLFFIVEPNGKQSEKIAQLIEDGKVKTVVDSIWKFEEYEKAFEKVESGRARGKVVMQIAGSN